MLGDIEGKRRRRQKKMRWLDSWTRQDRQEEEDEMDMNLSELWEIVEDRGAWQATVHGVAKSWPQLSD